MDQKKSSFPAQDIVVAIRENLLPLELQLFEEGLQEIGFNPKIEEFVIAMLHDMEGKVLGQGFNYKRIIYLTILGKNMLKLTKPDLFFPIHQKVLLIFWDTITKRFYEQVGSLPDIGEIEKEMKKQKLFNFGYGPEMEEYIERGFNAM